MKIITLTTDFGLRDGYAGVLKGVIWSIAPDVQIADITHQVSPQNVMEGALTLARVASFFPAGTVHVAVVDPGVGTDRRPIAARLGDQFFVGPDNGLFTVLVLRAERNGDPLEVVHLNQPEYWLPEVSNVFHGRDIFAPSAAHLANGVPIGKMGELIDDAIRLELSMPTRLKNGWRGQVTSIDHFGNISTNLDRTLLSEMEVGSVTIGDMTIKGLVRAFGEGRPGQLVAMIDSSNALSIALVNGHAAELLHVQVGDPVEVVSP
jgi:S-adenosylmethionine hydrolase